MAIAKPQREPPAVGAAQLCDIVREAFRGDVARAADAFRSGATLSDRRVHEARKTLKHARACLRLLRPALGKPHYARCDAGLRAAAQPLSSARDAAVLLATLSELRARAGRDGLAPLQRALSAERLQRRRELLADRRALARAAERLRLVASDARTWDARLCDQPELEAALRRMYKRGRRAHAALVRDPNDEHAHALRKHAKYLWHALQLLEDDGRAGRHARALARRAHHLADQLGEDHDLVVLQAWLRERSALVEPPALRALERALEVRRARLQRRARATAATLFALKPRAFTARALGRV